MLQRLLRPRWETMWTDLALVPCVLLVALLFGLS